jgi:hypothetical protein
MPFKKIAKKFNFLTQKKTFILGLILFTLFLYFDYSLNNVFSNVLSLLFAIYLCFFIAVKTNQFIKSDKSIINIGIIILTVAILIIGLAMLDELLHKNNTNSPSFSFFPDVILIYILILIFGLIVALVHSIIKLLYQLLKKRLEILKLIVAIFLFVVSIFTLISIESIRDGLISLYYQKINPKAGTLYYEKEYKKEFNNAEDYQKKIIEKGLFIEYIKAEKLSQDMVNFLKKQKTEIDRLLQQREASLRKLIELDEICEKIRLSKDKINFYQKRKIADTNELNGFLQYKKAINHYLEGNIILFSFNNLSDTIIDLIFLSDDKKVIKNQVGKLEKEINHLYEDEFKKARYNKVLSEEIIDRIDYQYSLLNKAIEYYYLSLESGAENKLLQKQQELTALIETRKTGEKTMNQLYQEWVDYYIYPQIYLQDKIHKQSFYLYQDSYQYAKKIGFNDVLNIWNGNYPGYEKNETKKDKQKPTKEELENYYQIYNDPMTIYIRTALNAYLQGDPQNVIPDEAKEIREDEEAIYGLDAFDKNYYRSKFIVYLIDDFPFGGKKYSIIFRDKPDKIFNLWIYDSNNKYELRSIWVEKNQDKKIIDYIKTNLNYLLNDEEHSL